MGGGSMSRTTTGAHGRQGIFVACDSRRATREVDMRRRRYRSLRRGRRHICQICLSHRQGVYAPSVHDARRRMRRPGLSLRIDTSPPGWEHPRTSFRSKLAITSTSTHQPGTRLPRLASPQGRPLSPGHLPLIRTGAPDSAEWPNYTLCTRAHIHTPRTSSEPQVQAICASTHPPHHSELQVLLHPPLKNPKKKKHPPKRRMMRLQQRPETLVVERVRTGRDEERLADGDREEACASVSEPWAGVSFGEVR